MPARIMEILGTQHCRRDWVKDAPLCYCVDLEENLCWEAKVRALVLLPKNAYYVGFIESGLALHGHVKVVTTVSIPSGPCFTDTVEMDELFPIYTDDQIIEDTQSVDYGRLMKCEKPAKSAEERMNGKVGKGCIAVSSVTGKYTICKATRDGVPVSTKMLTPGNQSVSVNVSMQASGQQSEAYSDTYVKRFKITELESPNEAATYSYDPYIDHCEAVTTPTTVPVPAVPPGGGPNIHVNNGDSGQLPYSQEYHAGSIILLSQPSVPYDVSTRWVASQISNLTGSALRPSEVPPQLLNRRLRND